MASRSGTGQWMEGAFADAMQEASRRREKIQQVRKRAEAWPAGHVLGPDEATPVPFHAGQQAAWESTRRRTAVIAGTQSGKTVWGPWWLNREIQNRGGGDYYAVTATYDLFKQKMLPSLRFVFEEVLGTGRYWSGARVMELIDPESGEFHAQRADDLMWGRIILRSADSEGGLEAGTAKAMWLDEAGQDRFGFDAYKALRRRGAIHQARELVTTTLYNLAWVKTQYIDPAEKSGKTELRTMENGAQMQVTDCAEHDLFLIQFDSILNPAYDVGEWQYWEAILPAEEFEMMMRGHTAKLRWLVYDIFDRVQDTCPRFEIPSTWERFAGIDFGGVNTVALFYAEDPQTKTLYCYRMYKDGRKAAREHARDLLEGEPRRPQFWGGAPSEIQERREYATAGLPIVQPLISDYYVGINRVYAQHKQRGIVYFDDLEDVFDEKARCKRKRDRNGNITKEVENRRIFHLLDAERYVIGSIRQTEPAGGKSAMAEARERLEAESRWGTQPVKRGSRWRKN